MITMKSLVPRALSDAETRYAQIEKKPLFLAFGLEKFHHYTYGRKVTVQTDHKPTETITKKSLHMVLETAPVSPATSTCLQL